MANELVASSLDSSEEENGRQEEKRRKIDHAKEAQLAHHKMCQKESHGQHEQCERLARKSDYLFRQVQEIRKKEAMSLLHIYSSRAALGCLTELINIRLTHFDHLIIVHVFGSVLLGAHSRAVLNRFKFQRRLQIVINEIERASVR